MDNEDFVDEVFDGLREIAFNRIGEGLSGRDLDKALLKWANRNLSPSLTQTIRTGFARNYTPVGSKPKKQVEKINVATCLNNHGIDAYFNNGLEYEIKSFQDNTLIVIDNFGVEQEVFKSKFSEGNILSL